MVDIRAAATSILSPVIGGSPFSFPAREIAPATAAPGSLPPDSFKHRRCKCRRRKMRTAGRSLFRECANGSPKLHCSYAFSGSDPHRKYDTYGRSAQPRRRSFGFRSKGMTEAREVDFIFARLWRSVGIRSSRPSTRARCAPGIARSPAGVRSERGTEQGGGGGREGRYRNALAADRTSRQLISRISIRRCRTAPGRHSVRLGRPRSNLAAG